MQARLDLAKHQAAFNENGVDGPLLILLQPDDLRLLGVSSDPEARFSQIYNY